MSGYGYPHNPPGYGYGYPPNPQPPTSQPPTAQPYGAPPPTAKPYGGQPPTAQPYGAPPSAPPYGKPDKPAKDNYSSSGSGYNYPSAPPYGQPDKPPKDNYSSSGSGYNYPSAPPYGKPDKPTDNYSSSGSGHSYPSAPPHAGYGSGYSGYSSGPPQGYGSAPPQQYGGGGYPPQQTGGGPFSALLPSTFPPGTDPTVIACFQVADLDGSGLIDDKELQKALSSYNQSFSLSTVHLLMVHFTNSNTRKIGPKEFTTLFYGLQSWREIFERFDKDRSGKIDTSELRDALFSLGFAVSPVILDLLISKFDKTGGKSKAIEYDNFIECCLTVKGLTEKFKEKDKQYQGTATFTYEEFMLTVLPYLVA